jgi:hypothetical protein
MGVLSAIDYVVLLRISAQLAADGSSGKVALVSRYKDLRLCAVSPSLEMMATRQFDRKVRRDVHYRIAHPR